jgi:hypothetical protein
MLVLDNPLLDSVSGKEAETEAAALAAGIQI